MKRCRKLAIPTKKTKADVLNGPGVASASAAGGCDFDIPEILLCMILPGRKLFGCLNNIARLKVVLTACWRLQWFSMIFRLFFLGISSSDLFYIYIYIYIYGGFDGEAPIKKSGFFEMISLISGETATLGWVSSPGSDAQCWLCLLVGFMGISKGPPPMRPPQEISH